jgi:threonine aldolase
VVFFDRKLSEEFDYRCKQGGQLASKMRFSSAPWAACLRGGVWLRHAENANRMARLLADRLGGVPGVEIVRPVAANAVFALISPPVQVRLQEAGWRYYEFIGGAARLMTSWRTSEEDVVALIASARSG